MEPSSIPTEPRNMDTEKLNAKRRKLMEGPTYRISVLVGLIASIVTFVLSLIVLLSSARNVQMLDNNMVSFNVSTLGQNVIKIDTSPPSPSSVARAVKLVERVPKPFPKAMPDPTPAPVAMPMPLNPFISSASQFFASVGSDIASATIPGIPSPTGTGLASQIIADLTTLIVAIEGNLTDEVAGLLVNGSNKLIEGALDSAGVQQWYGLYMTQYCAGNYTPSYDAPNAKVNVSSCVAYSSLNTTSSLTNSTIQIGNVYLDFSALNLSNKLSGKAGTLQTLLTAFKAFQIIGIVCSGLLILLLPLFVIFSFLRKPMVGLGFAGLAGLGSIVLMTTASIVTSISVLATGTINQLAAGLGAEAYKSNSTLAMMWVSAVLMHITAGSFVLQWFKGTFVKKNKLI